MTPEAALFGAITHHVEGCSRLRRRLDHQARRALIGARWRKITGRSDNDRATAAAEWGAAIVASVEALARR